MKEINEVEVLLGALLAWVPSKVEPETKFKCRHLLHW